jgi:hypothetical protein
MRRATALKEPTLISDSSLLNVSALAIDDDFAAELPPGGTSRMLTVAMARRRLASTVTDPDPTIAARIGDVLTGGR